MKQTAVYRLFNANGRLLYVGVSRSFMIRMDAHAVSQKWWLDVARIDIVNFPTREIALAMEKQAIEDEGPEWNVMHSTVRKPKKTVRTAVVLSAYEIAEAHKRAEYIISHIRESGKTVAGVCREAGITRATFYNAIKAGSNPYAGTLEAIAAATGLTLEQVRKGVVE